MNMSIDKTQNAPGQIPVINRADAANGAELKRAEAAALLRPIAPAEIEALLNGKKAPKEVRVRFAPSPTGYLHIGNFRAALANYLFAKKMGGKFFLRIEDTNRQKSKPEYAEAIKETLLWAGLKWDGDIVVQSEREDVYQQKINELIQKGLAYVDGEGAVRFRVQGGVSINDRIRGLVQIDARNLADEAGNTDFIIRRSPKNGGTATFLLANAVDDGEAGITHVFRGVEHLSNAALQIPLFKAMGYEPPEFYHMPLIHGDDGKKLAKRHGATSVLDYERDGFDPNVFVNHLARLGMSFKNVGDMETLSLDELAAHLDPWGFSKAPARIDLPKLFNRNRRIVRAMSLDQIKDVVKERDPVIAERLGPNGLDALAKAAQPRASTLGEIVDIAKFVLDENHLFHIRAEFVAIRKEQMDLVAEVLNALDALPAEQWNQKEILENINNVLKRRNLGFAALGPTLRWVLTGYGKEGLPDDLVLAMLGKDAGVARLRRAIAGELTFIEDWIDAVVQEAKMRDENPLDEAISQLIGLRETEEKKRAEAEELRIAQEAEERRLENDQVRQERELAIRAFGHNNLPQEDLSFFGEPVLFVGSKEYNLAKGKLPEELLQYLQIEGYPADQAVNAKAVCEFMLAAYAQNGVWPEIEVLDNALFSSVSPQDNGWIRFESAELESEEELREFFDKVGAGPVDVSFSTKNVPQTQKEAIKAWTAVANYQMFLSSLERRNVAEADPEPLTWAFKFAGTSVPVTAHVEHWTRTLDGGLDAESALAENLMIALDGGDELYADAARVGHAVQGGLPNERIVVLNTLRQAQRSKLWGYPPLAIETMGFKLPALNEFADGQEAIQQIPAGYRGEELFGSLIAEGVMTADERDVLVEMIRGCAFNDNQNLRLKHFDQRVLLPLIELENIPHLLSKEHKTLVKQARLRFVRNLLQMAAEQPVDQQQRVVDICKAVIVYAQEAKLAEPLQLWLAGEHPVATFAKRE